MSHATSAPVSTTPTSSGPATSVPRGCSSRALHSTVASGHRTPIMSNGTLSSSRSPARIVNLGGRPESIGRSLMGVTTYGTNGPPIARLPVLPRLSPRRQRPSPPGQPRGPAELGRSRRSNPDTAPGCSEPPRPTAAAQLRRNPAGSVREVPARRGGPGRRACIHRLALGRNVGFGTRRPHHRGGPRSRGGGPPRAGEHGDSPRCANPPGWKHASVGAARGGLASVGTGVDVTEFR